MSHKEQTTVVNRYQGESEDDYKDRIQSGVDQSKLWYQRFLNVTPQKFSMMTENFGDNKPYNTIVMDNEGHNIIVSQTENDDCQRVFIFTHKD